MPKQKSSEVIPSATSDSTSTLVASNTLKNSKESMLSKTTLPKIALPKSKSQQIIVWIWTAAKYLIMFIVIYTVANWWRQPVMPANPNLQLTDYQGQVVDIEALSDESPVLVYFWGTWCGVCQITSPMINRLAHTSPYPVITIATQSGNSQELTQYMIDKRFTFTTVSDESGEMFNAWEGQVTPSYVILNNGEMTQGLTGIQPEWSLRLRLWLSSLLN